MALVESLQSAIVRSDGDALVLHVGERPYVVAASGQVELSSRALTLDATAGMLGQLLSPEAEKALEELGAVEDQLPPLATAPDEHYSVVAARSGGDIWIEIRRHREVTPLPDPVAIEEPTLTAPQAMPEPAPPALVAIEESLFAAADAIRAPALPAPGPIVEHAATQVFAESAPRPVQSEPPAGIPQPPPVSGVDLPRHPDPAPVAAMVSDSTEEPPEQRHMPRWRKTNRVATPDADIPPVTMVPVPPSRAQVPRNVQTDS